MVDNIFPKGVLPKGALIEVSGQEGSGKTETVLRFLANAVAENPQIAWIEEGLTAYPCAFPQFGIGLDRVLFVDAGKGDARNLHWASLQILRSQIFKIVVISFPIGFKNGELVLRRLQLAAEKAQATVILLTELPMKQGAWPISVQLQVRRLENDAQIPTLTVLKHRDQRLWQKSLAHVG